MPPRQNPICKYCRQEIKCSFQKFSVADVNGKLLGFVHGYCHPYKSDDYATRGYTVKTGAGVIVRTKTKPT